jgi:hypothetical protein
MRSSAGSDSRCRRRYPDWGGRQQGNDPEVLWFVVGAGVR